MMSSTRGYSIGLAVVAVGAGLFAAGAASCGAFSTTDDAVLDGSAADASTTDSPAGSDGATPPDAAIPASEGGLDSGIVRHLHLFVLTSVWNTSTTYPSGGAPAHMGRDSADRYCADEAQSAGLGSAFIAWMSVPAGDAIARLPSDADWSLPNASGPPDLVFPSRAAIAQHPLHALDRDAKGASLAGTEARVWTGTDPMGAATTETCNGWNTFSPGPGTTGRTDSVGVQWTTGGTETCALGLHVYCFEH